jgi:hypothetical protein
MFPFSMCMVRPPGRLIPARRAPHQSPSMARTLLWWNGLPRSLTWLLFSLLVVIEETLRDQGAIRSTRPDALATASIAHAHSTSRV